MNTRNIEVKKKERILHSNLIYTSPAKRPIEGQAIGNGKMGTMVWTTPSSVNFQINRVDVFAVNKNHIGKQNDIRTDYCCGCASLKVDVGGNPFEGEDFNQTLNIYEAEEKIEGKSISIKCFISALDDLMIVEIDDKRIQAKDIKITLGSWRQPLVKTDEHTASYTFLKNNNSSVLTQIFKEREYYCSSVVGIKVSKDEIFKYEENETSVAYILSAKTGKRTIMLSSASTWDASINLKEQAIDILKKQGSQTINKLYDEHTKWWEKFWEKTFIHLSSEDGQAEIIEGIRNIFLYYSAISSRGILPPKWNGSIFTVDGDSRDWGSQFWLWTTETAYFPLYAADAIELTTPFFNMYYSQLEDAKIAARQRWGAKGAFFPETAPFDGAVVLPENVALEFRDVFLGEKETTELSAYARRLGKFEGHLHVMSREISSCLAGRYTWISHVLSSGAEIAMQVWWRYRYTGDIEWLKKYGYPILKEVAEFYYSFTKQNENGVYNIEGTNAHEDFWGVKNSIMDLAAIRGTVPLAIEAAKLLDVDNTYSVKWQEFLDNLAPYPMGDEKEAKDLNGGVIADDVWAAGYLGDVNDSHNAEDLWLNPVFPFEDWTIETKDPLIDTMVHKILDIAPRLNSIMQGARSDTAIRSPIAAVRIGCDKKLPEILRTYFNAFPILPNKMSTFEGAKAHSIEILGVICSTLQDSLLQSVSPRPGEAEVISVFPSWPRKWDASYKLLARGGFLITTAIKDGYVSSVLIESRNAEECRTRNPWGKVCLLKSEDNEGVRIKGDIICFKTKKNHKYILTEGKNEDINNK